MTTIESKATTEDTSGTKAPSTSARVWFSGSSVVLSTVILASLTISGGLSEFRWVAFALVGLLPLVAVILGPRPLRILGFVVLAFIQLVAYSQHTRWELATRTYIEDARLK